MVGMRGVDEKRHLMRSKRALDFQPVDDLRPCPTLGRSRTIMGQRGRAGPCCPWRSFESSGSFRWLSSTVSAIRPMHHLRIVALDEQRIPAATAKELLQFLMLDAGEDRRVADLEAVEVQDRQNRSVRDRIEEFVGLPGGRQGARLASPSPTMQATINPGLSNAAPKAWLSEYPSSPPSWMEPGVVGATSLEMPPGKENCLNSLFIPASS